jgi:hypothetical protein
MVLCGVLSRYHSTFEHAGALERTEISAR